MSIFHNNGLIGASGQGGGAGGYSISRSLRFNSSDSAYLSRTPASAGNRKTWTWAGWVKRSNLTDQQAFWSAGSTGTNRTSVLFDGSARVRFFNYAGSVDVDLVTTPVYRDASAWYHLVIAVDTTQGTASNRIKLYVNGVEVTTFSTSTYPSSSQDLVFNSAIAHGIGRGEQSGGEYFSGYLADIYFIDGQALTPSSFTETDATTGQLIPKAFTGSYGTNGFHLEFADNSSNTATTLGKDTSGNGNNWTPNNLSVTAGAGNDSLVDVPSSSGTDTGVGGEVRGNYATLNPLVTNSTTTLANGNLDATGSEQVTGFSSIVPSSGKWYLEITLGTVGSNSFIGLAGTTPIFGSYCVYGINGFGFANTGWGSPSSTVSGTGAAGDVIGLAFDVDAKTLQFYKNGSSIGTISAFTYPQNWSIGFRCNAAVSTPWVFNFGQRPFAYTAPSGFKALCTTNLPAPLVTKPNTVMDVKLYTGNGSTQTISGLGFEPDLVWLKGRSVAYSHQLYDQVRGAGKLLGSNTTNAESTVTDNLTAFTSTGFSLGSDAGTNQSSATYAAWTWDAGSSTVTNTQGSITSSVRANATAGFSIVTWTGNGATNATVGHGLGVTPAMIIAKNRSTTNSWAVWFTGFTANEYLVLNSTAAKATFSTQWGSTPTSTVFGVADTSVNGNGNSIVAYCFAPVVGYSSFGSYVGNGSSDGVFVYTGFRPRWVMIKASSSTGDWYIIDTARDIYNLSGKSLQANTSNAEPSIGGSFSMTDDILSNGFKLRDGGSGSNGSSVTYIYAAFAESPFNYARAR